MTGKPSAMKTYTGERTFDGIVVSVDGQPLNSRRDLKAYTDNHFEWGYEGEESTQLALAILADAASDEQALQHATAFMHAIVANFSNEWEITDQQVRQALVDLN